MQFKVLLYSWDIKKQKPVMEAGPSLDCVTCIGSALLLLLEAGSDDIDMTIPIESPFSTEDRASDELCGSAFRTI